MRRIAIVGAGITGLTAARHLVDHGFDLCVFDKGRGRGGRIASRRTEQGVFSHGSLRVDVRSSDFDDFLTDLGSLPDDESGRITSPRLRRIFDGFDDRIELHQRVRVASLAHDREGWVLNTDAERDFVHFDDVLLTVPAPQAAALLQDCDAALAARLDQVVMQPVWTCMASFKAPLKAFEVPTGGPVLRAERMPDEAQPGGEAEAWVIHMTPEFTRRTIDAEPAQIAPLLLETVADTCGLGLPPVAYLNAHRWRYAFAETPLGEPCVKSVLPGLWVGGDWTLGHMTEDAFQSGCALAQAVLSREAASV